MPISISLVLKFFHNGFIRSHMQKSYIFMSTTKNMFRLQWNSRKTVNCYAKLKQIAIEVFC